MSDIDKSIVLELCEGQPQEIQNIIKVAYWQGCTDGLNAAKTKEHKISRREDNVIYLKDQFLPEKT